MPIKDIREAVRHFHSISQPHRLCTIEASDTFIREECVEQYVLRWRAKEKIVFLDGKELESQDLGADNLFGDMSLFVVDVSSIKAKEAPGVLSLVGEAGKNNHFVLISSEALPKAIVEAADCAVQVPALKPWDKQPFLISWVVERCKKEKKTITKEAAALLVDNCMQDRRTLLFELEKVFLFRLNEPSIGLADVEKIYCPNVHSTMWQCLDALVARDGGKLATCLSSSDDWNAIALLRFLKNQLEKLLIAVEAGATPRSKSHERQLDTIRQIGNDIVCSWMRALDMKELAIRTGTQDPDVASLLPFFLSLSAKS